MCWEISVFLWKNVEALTLSYRHDLREKRLWHKTRLLPNSLIHQCNKPHGFYGWSFIFVDCEMCGGENKHYLPPPETLNHTLPRNHFQNRTSFDRSPNPQVHCIFSKIKLCSQFSFSQESRIAIAALTWWRLQRQWAINSWHLLWYPRTTEG